jgi:hypothetical protein
VPPVIPEGFPEWEERMDLWGNKMIAALEVCHLNILFYFILTRFKYIIYIISSLY